MPKTFKEILDEYAYSEDGEFGDGHYTEEMAIKDIQFIFIERLRRLIKKRRFVVGVQDSGNWIELDGMDIYFNQAIEACIELINGEKE